MDSLLANYASSDDEEQPSPPPLTSQRIPPVKLVRSETKAEEERDGSLLPKSITERGGIFNSLPPPKSSVFNLRPPPKSKSFSYPKSNTESEYDDRDEHIVENPKPNPSSASLFSSIPLPNSSSLSLSSFASKKVVQFRPPIIVNPSTGGFDDKDEDSDEGEQERQRNKSKESISTSSVTSFLSSIPAPRHSATLGSLPSASGRRSMLETDTPASSVSIAGATGIDAVVNTDQSKDMSYGYSSLISQSGNHGHYSDNAAGPDGKFGPAPRSNISMGGDACMNQVHEKNDHSNSLGVESSGYYGYYGGGSADASGVVVPASDAAMNFSAGSYEGGDGNGGHVEYTNYYGSYGEYVNNAQYESNWANMTLLPDESGVVEASLQVFGKRGRKDVPPQIIEVKQDELMKNRPREDQVKLTGIAFGPAYQVFVICLCAHLN
ncbi:hypothetical protein OROMI_011133 [Orobanche minor]